MLSQPGQPHLPSNLQELALFDAINGAGQLGIVQAWVLARLDDDLRVLTATTEQVERLAHLAGSLRFRAYYSSSDFYVGTHVALKAAIDGWFRRHAAALGGESAPELGALRDNYQVISVGGAHDSIVGRGDHLRDALDALPGRARPGEGATAVA